MSIEEVREEIAAYERTVKYTVCDTCGKKFTDTSWGVIKKCHICDDHVCKECAVITDHWCLEHGEFYGDYPDYYCPKCWESGSEIRQQIQLARDRESELWKQWHGSTPRQ